MVAKMTKNNESLRQLLSKYWISDSDIDYLISNGFVKYPTDTNFADKRFAFTIRGIEIFGPSLYPTFNGLITLLRYAYSSMSSQTDYMNTVMNYAGYYKTPIEVTLKDNYATNHYIYYTSIETAENKADLNVVEGKVVEIIPLGDITKQILDNRIATVPEVKPTSTTTTTIQPTDFFQKYQNQVLIALTVIFFLFAVSKGKIFKKGRK